MISRRMARLRPFVPLVMGVGALALALAAGWTDLFDAVLHPPGPVRALLAAAAGLLGVVLVLRSAERIGTSHQPRELVRSVRLVFLAVASFAAAVGWFIGSPVPVIVALVIAAVDVIETSLLLLVTAARSDDGARSADR